MGRLHDCRLWRLCLGTPGPEYLPMHSLCGIILQRSMLRLQHPFRRYIAVVMSGKT